MTTKIESPIVELYQNTVIPVADDDRALLPNGQFQNWARMAEVNAKTATFWMARSHKPESEYFDGVNDGDLVRALAANATARQTHLTDKQLSEFNRIVERMVKDAVENAERLSHYLAK